MPDLRRFVQLTPSQLTVSPAFPRREIEPPLSDLKQTILENGGLLRPIIVRSVGKEMDLMKYLVLDGRRQLEGVNALLNDGYDKMFRSLPAYVIHSDGPIMDLKLFLVLNQHAPLGTGEYERIRAAIDEAQKPPGHVSMCSMPESRRFLQLKPSQLTVSMAFPRRELEPPLSELKQTIIEYGGLLRPIVVRCAGKKNNVMEYLVLDGRRELEAVWSLQDDGYEKLFRWLPCYVIHSDGPIMDLRHFLVLNQHAPLGTSEYEKVLAAIEDAQKAPPLNQLG